MVVIKMMRMIKGMVVMRFFCYLYAVFIVNCVFRAIILCDYQFLFCCETMGSGGFLLIMLLLHYEKLVMFSGEIK